MDCDPLPLNIWVPQAEEHINCITPFADGFIKRRSVGKKEPVHDFLFTYYNFSPTKLKQWVPSYKQRLLFPDTYREKFPWLCEEERFTLKNGVLQINFAKLQPNFLGLAEFIAELCENILKRPPRFGCFGLHEWAMVYQLSHDEIRHNQLALRLPPEEISRFVESQHLCCTHYDAFRFFTEKARPRNSFTPTLDSRPELEQAGCIHANMDLYKWSAKLWPWIGSDFIAKTFRLALKARELDMRASPYDLEVEGYPPICIETEEGRKLYQREQQLLTESSIPLRQELLAFCKGLTITHSTIYTEGG